MSDDSLPKLEVPEEAPRKKKTKVKSEAKSTEEPGNFIQQIHILKSPS